MLTPTTEQQLIDQLVLITYIEAAALNKILTTFECFEIAQKIILTNYPKCLSKYLNNEPWAL
jgi:hypothetical protein